MTRRGLAAVAGGLAAALSLGTAAYADGALPVSVGAVAPGQVRLVAALPSGAGGRISPVTVSRDGYALPAAVQPGVAGGAKAPARTLTVVVDAGPDTADATRAAVEAFAGGVPDDVALGLVAATEPPVVAVPPTRDRDAFRAGLDGLRVDTGVGPLTALRTAAALATRDGERRLLLVAADGTETDPESAAVRTNLARAGQRVDVVTAGSAGATGATGAAGPVGSAGEDLRAIASATGGGYRTATAGTLTAALRSAATPPALFTITVPVPPELAGKQASLRVSAGTGAARSSADLDVRFADAPAGAATDGGGGVGALVPGGLRSGVLGILIFLVLLVALLLVVFGTGGTRRQRRLDQVQRFRLGGRGAAGGVPVMSGAGLAGTVSNLSGRVARAAGDDQRVAKRLDDAGIALRPAQWRTIQLAAIAGGAFLVGLLLGLLGILLGALLGLLLSMFYPRLRERRRQQSFADALPDALQLIVGSLRSGFSLTQSLDGVVRDAPPGPLSIELGRAMAEVRLGADLADALDRAAVRADNQDLAWAVIAIRIQHETGGNLAETLETTVDTIRERARLRRHVRALSAEGRLSAYLLLGLPVAIGAWMFLVSRAYLSVLWTTTVGLAMLVGAGVLMALGALWMARWLKVEV